MDDDVPTREYLMFSSGFRDKSNLKHPTDHHQSIEEEIIEGTGIHKLQ